MNAHCLTHAALAAAHGVMTVSLALEGAICHAVCSAVAWVAYAVLVRLARTPAARPDGGTAAAADGAVGGSDREPRDR